MSERSNNSLLFKWGVLIARFRWIALLLPLVLCVALVPLALQVTDRLSAGGWLPSDADSMRVDRMLADEFDRKGPSNYLLFSDPTGRLKATDPEFRREVERIVKPLRLDPEITSVFTWGTTSNDQLNKVLISDDGSMSLAVIAVRHDSTRPPKTFAAFKQQVTSSLFDIKIGGWPATTDALGDLTSSDLARAERLSVPITIVLLILIYGGLIAAALPVALAIGTITVALATLTIISQRLDASVFAVNAVTMLGLAVGIDYALILISRYREELLNHDPEAALARALATGGRSILIAGAAVAVGLAGLLAFGVPAAISTGLAGATVVLTSVLLGLTSLPAALLILNRRLGHHTGYLGRIAPTTRSRLVKDISRFQAHVHANAGIAACACVLLLAFLALPVLSMKGGSPTMAILPTAAEARQMYDAVSTRFSSTTLSPITVIVQPRDGRMTSSTNLENLHDFTNVIGAMPGVTDVNSLWSYVPNAASALAVSSGLTLDRDLQTTTHSYITSRAALIQISIAGKRDEGRQQAFHSDRGRRERYQHRSRPYGQGTGTIGGCHRCPRDLAHSFPAVRIGPPAGKGNRPQLALALGVIRRARLDLPGGPSVRSARFRADRPHRRHPANPDVLLHVWPQYGLRSDHAVAHQGSLGCDRR